jgi:hypothetical protein
MKFKIHFLTTDVWIFIGNFPDVVEYSNSIIYFPYVSARKFGAEKSIHTSSIEINPYINQCDLNQEPH